MQRALEEEKVTREQFYEQKERALKMLELKVNEKFEMEANVGNALNEIL